MDSSPDEENNIEIWGSDPTCLTFMLRNEDHTLGNALRYVLIKNPDVRFCGYSIPHPSENIMNIRVETYGRPATGLFRKALLDLRAMAEHIGTAFEAEVENFAALQREQ